MKRILHSLVVGAAMVAGSLTAASASHPTQLCLDVGADQVYPTSFVGSENTLTAFPGATDAGHPPEHEGCVTGQEVTGGDWGGTNIDFEVTGVADPDSSDSPETPDLTCTVPAGADRCDVEPPESGGGTQTIRAWLDIDLNDATTEADRVEGYDEETAPGDSPEPDTTDVTEWQWSHADVEYLTTVRIEFQRKAGSFSGRVESDFAGCRNERTIKLFKLIGDRKRLKGTTETTSDGAWMVTGFRRAAGRFFAIAPNADVVEEETNSFARCLRGRSRTLRVP